MEVEWSGSTVDCDLEVVAIGVVVERLRSSVHWRTKYKRGGGIKFSDLLQGCM